MDSGFILLSRRILDSEVFASQKLLKIWIWCLCKANFKDKNIPLKVGKGETIVNVKRGSFLFGRYRAEDELFIDGSTIYKSMKKLEDMGMIEIDSNNQYSVVSVCNYDSYQDSNNYQVTSKEQVSNNEVTSKSQPSNTTKNDNNVNKDKQIELLIYPSFDDFWNLYDKKTGRKKCESKWNKLSQKTKEEIMAYIPKYKLSTPDIKYRKNPETFLNSESWNDELILKQNNYGNKQFTSNSEYASITQALRDSGLQ